VSHENGGKTTVSTPVKCGSPLTLEDVRKLYINERCGGGGGNNRGEVWNLHIRSCLGGGDTEGIGAKEEGKGKKKSFIRR